MIPDLDALNFDDELKAAVAFLIASPPSPPAEPLPAEDSRAFWQAATDIYNRAAPDVRVERGVELREGDADLGTAPDFSLNLVAVREGQTHALEEIVHRGSFHQGPPSEGQKVDRS